MLLLHLSFPLKEAERPVQVVICSTGTVALRVMITELGFQSLEELVCEVFRCSGLNCLRWGFEMQQLGYAFRWGTRLTHGIVIAETESCSWLFPCSPNAT